MTFVDSYSWTADHEDSYPQPWNRRIQICPYIKEYNASTGIVTVDRVKESWEVNHPPGSDNSWRGAIEVSTVFDIYFLKKKRT